MYAQERDRYLLLATTRTGTMQQEIDAAVASGYRVVDASRTESAQVIVVLEQTSGKCEYRLLATTKTGTLQKEMNDADHEAVGRDRRLHAFACQLQQG